MLLCNYADSSFSEVAPRGIDGIPCIVKNAKVKTSKKFICILLENSSAAHVFMLCFPYKIIKSKRNINAWDVAISEYPLPIDIDSAVILIESQFPSQPCPPRGNPASLQQRKLFVKCLLVCHSCRIPALFWLRISQTWRSLAFCLDRIEHEMTIELKAQEDF